MFGWRCIDCGKKYKRKDRWWGDVHGLKRCDRCALVFSIEKNHQINIEKIIKAIKSEQV
jgi:hypothetical protein